MKLVESWGVNTINHYLDNDFLLAKYPYQHITLIATSLSFIVGFCITLIIAVFDIIFFADVIKLIYSPKELLSFIIINVLLVGLEFWLLFHIGFQVTARYINELEGDFFNHQIKASLVRAVLEFNEPATECFGLNPYRNRKQKYGLKLILYKLKVFFSNFTAKLVIRKVLSRSSFRIYVPLVSTVITGFWDFWVQKKVLKEVRSRIKGRLFSIELMNSLDSTLYSKEYVEALIRVIAVRLELYDDYNINLDYLLNELEKKDRAVSRLDKLFDIEIMKQSFMSLSYDERNRLCECALSLFSLRWEKLSEEENEMLEFFK